MMLRMKSGRIAVVLLAGCMCATQAQQPSRVSLIVKVTDQTGAIIPSAGVRATSISTGTMYDHAVNSDGSVSLELPGGTYDLRVQAPGWQRSDWKNIEVRRTEEKTVILIPGQPACSIPCNFVFYPSIPVEPSEVSAAVPLSPLVLLPLRPKSTHRH